MLLPGSTFYVRNYLETDASVSIQQVNNRSN